MYGSLDLETVWAEWARATDGAVAPEDDPRRLCVFDADLAVLDLREPAVVATLDVTLDDLVIDWSDRDPNTACLVLARLAGELGADAVIVPSAARAGGWNLVVQPVAFASVRPVSRKRTTPAPPSG